MEISEWYRGRSVTLADLLHMPIGYISALNKLSYEQSKDKALAEKRAAQHAEDAMVDHIG